MFLDILDVLIGFIWSHIVVGFDSSLLSFRLSKTFPLLSLEISKTHFLLGDL